MDPIRNLQQPLAWNPLDLTDENLPASQDVAIDEGTGFLPDLTDSRPALRPVRGPLSEAPSPSAPWNQ